MRVLLVLAAALLLASPGVQAVSDPLPYKAVRIITDADGDQRCSAVVIEPGVAVTARHCLNDIGLYVDGYRVEEAKTYRAQTPDAAVIYAPGLACPCAKLGASPTVDTQVLAVGFAGSLNGEYRIAAVGRVKHVGRLDVFAPWIGAEDEFGAAQYIVTNPITEPGDSGGALFAMQGGEWRLVGITSIGMSDPASCMPFYGCMVPLASGFVPIEAAISLLKE